MLLLKCYLKISFKWVIMGIRNLCNQITLFCANIIKNLSNVCLLMRTILTEGYFPFKVHDPYKCLRFSCCFVMLVRNKVIS